MKSTVYLIPIPIGESHYEHVIPEHTKSVLLSLRCFAVENIKVARRYLRRMDSSFPIDDSTFFVLDKSVGSSELGPMTNQLKAGENIGIISDAGCPGVADPGSKLVAEAQRLGYRIEALVGPSSILLGLMGSGFSGQSFCFHGYLDKDRKKRIQEIQYFEREVKKNGQTQIFMDTPYRSDHVLEDLLNQLNGETLLCIAANLFNEKGYIKTKPVKDWRSQVPSLKKLPVMFLIGKS